MTKCKDGRKRVIVGNYKRKDGKAVSQYIRGCPSNKPDDVLDYCCVCGEDFQDYNFQKFDVKGFPKKICNECVDTIHGLV